MQLKTDDELNERHKNIFMPMNEIADQLMPQLWDMAVKVLNQFTPMSGDEAISALSTLVAHFLAKWVICMKLQIVNKDETGRATEELLLGIFEGASSMLSKKFVPPEKQTQSSHSDIKGIKYDWK